MTTDTACATANQGPAISVAAGPGALPASILIVEDEAIIAMDLQERLEALGYRVVGIADTTARALETARHESPSLVLMDIRLRGGDDGVVAAGRIADELHIPVVFLTSHSDAATIERASSATAYGFLTKPFRAGELHAGIEVALAKARAEHTRQENQRWHAAALRGVGDGVIVTDTAGQVRFVNHAAESMLAMPSRDVLSREVDDVLRFHAGPERTSRSAAHQVVREGRDAEVEYGRRLLTRTGEVAVDEMAAPIRDDKGRQVGAVLVLRDSRERRAHEQRLVRESNERQRTFLTNASIGVATVTLNERFEDVNPALARMLGRDAPSLQNTSLAASCLPDDLEHERSQLRRLLAGGVEAVQYEKRFVARGGAVRRGLVSVALRHVERRVTAYLYQVHDITGYAQAGGEHGAAVESK